MDASTSQQRWEIENEVENTDEYLRTANDPPPSGIRPQEWSDPKYFKKCAAVPCVNHACYARPEQRTLSPPHTELLRQIVHVFM